VWWVKYFDGGRAHYESSGSQNRADAENLLKRRQGEVALGRFVGLNPERVKLAELFTDVENDYRLRNRKSIDDVESRIRLHLLPAFGHLRARSLTTEDRTRYVLARRNAGASNSTINRELAILRRAYKLGASADPPKVLRVPRILKLEEDNVRTGFLEHDQYVRLRDELPTHVQLLFVVGYHTGIRRGELLNIRWAQVDLEANEIKLSSSATKNKKPRTVPIYGEMKAWLELEKQKRDQLQSSCQWVFSKGGRRLGDFRKVWANACQKVDLPDLLFHDLRRSAVRNMERAGVPRNVAMEISGHRTESVYRRYDIVSQRDLQRAGAALEKYLATQLRPREEKKIQNGGTIQ